MTHDWWDQKAGHMFMFIVVFGAFGMGVIFGRLM
jgi:hypothetical protein